MANARRLETLSWCKCGQYTLSTKAIECFCCHEKALEYDEYDVLLNQTESYTAKNQFLILREKKLILRKFS